MPMELSSNSIVISDNSLNKTHTPSDVSTKIPEKPSKLATSSKLGLSVAKNVADKSPKAKETSKEYVPEYVHAKRWMDYCEFVSAFR